MRGPTLLTPTAVLLLLATCRGLADTPTGGLLTGSVTWNLSGSPYVITQDLVIASGGALQIEPGVSVRFHPARSLVVSNGLLSARGTALDPIVFDSFFAPPSADSNRWGAVVFLDDALDAQFDVSGVCTGGCAVEYADIRHAGGVTDIDGAICASNASPFIGRSILAENIRGGVFLSGGYGARLEENSISSNMAPARGGGIRVESLQSRPDLSGIIGEVVGTGNGLTRTFGGTLIGHPVRPGSLTLTDGVEVLADPDGDGALSGGVGASGNVQYTTGVFTATFTLEPGAGMDIVADYVSDRADPLALLCITNNVICGNSADTGGGVFMSRAPGMNLAANTIAWNWASNAGGGLCLESHSGSQLIGNGIFSNQAPRGGGICLAGDGYAMTPVVDEVVATGNGGDRTFEGQLNVHPVDPGSVTITDGVEMFSDSGADGFLTGSAGGSGTVSYVSGDVSVTFLLEPGNGVPILASYTSGFGGAVPPLVISGNRIGTNRAVAGGGIWAEDIKALELGGNLLFQNAAVDGGALLLTNCRRAQISGNGICSNGATGGGGGLLANGVDLMFLTNTIAANWATNAGGGLSFEFCSNTTLNANGVWGNDAHDGGGLSLTSCFGSTLVLNGVSNNVATNGAGIWVAGGSLGIGTNTVAGNAAVGAGGGVLLKQLQALELSGNTVVSNSAFLGGGINLMACDWELPARMAGNIVGENTAHMGGGLLISDSTNLQFQGNQVERNRANFSGGLLIADVSELDMSDNQVCSNAAVIAGGMRITASMARVQTNQFLCNMATNYGGGLYLDACTNAVLAGNSFRGNSAGMAGGGLHISSCYLGSGAGLPVSNEVVAVGNGLQKVFSGTLSGAPVVPASLSITDGAELFTDDDGDQVLTGSAGGTGTVNHDSGAFSVSFLLEPGAGQDIHADYLRRDSSWFMGNTIADNQAGQGGGVFMSSTSNAWLIGCAIVSNSAATGSGLLLTNVTGNVVLGSLSNMISMIVGNTGSSQLHNGTVFQGSFDPVGPGNVDARNVWWATTDASAISNSIHDYSDDATRGIVFTDPVVQPFTLSLASYGWGHVIPIPDLAIYPPFQVVELTALPSNGWYFTAWSNDLTGAAPTGTVVLTGNLAVDAWFSPYLVTHDTPVWWLLAHGLGTNDSDALEDADADGSLNWQEYYAGTVPTNPGSVLAFSNIVGFSDIFYALSWASSTGRFYTVSSATNLIDPLWTPQQTGLSATPPVNVTTVTVPAVSAFFRIELE